MITESIEAILWDQVDRKPNGCWEWPHHKDKDGYGVIYADAQNPRAHRAAFESAYGEYPAELFVCHTCDNPPCCRPTHLFLGTAADNANDRNAKGRHFHGYDAHSYEVRPRGERSGMAVMTEGAVILMRAMYAQGIHQGTIAEAFGVSISAVNHCCSRRTWRHVA